MNKTEVKPVEDGMQTVAPHMSVQGAAEAIEFYKKAFGAQEIMRMPMPGGKIGHAMIRIGDSMVMLADETPEWDNKSPATLKGTPITLHLSVPNVDEVFRNAVKAGGKVVMEVADQFWGDRYGVLEDPFGHRWSVSTHIKDVSPEEMQAAMDAMMEKG